MNLRYGVIAMDDLLRDLEHWETLLISSFMHRPFEVLESGSTESYDELMEKQLLNLRSAVSYLLSCLSHHHSFSSGCL